MYCIVPLVKAFSFPNEKNNSLIFEITIFLFGQNTALFSFQIKFGKQMKIEVRILWIKEFFDNLLKLSLLYIMF